MHGLAGHEPSAITINIFIADKDFDNSTPINVPKLVALQTTNLPANPGRTVILQGSDIAVAAMCMSQDCIEYSAVYAGLP